MQIRRTKIIAALGPATDTPEALKALIKAGADVLRINMSHGTHEEQAARAAQVRSIAHMLKKEVAILCDLRGPKVRVESFINDSVTLEEGDVFTLDASDDAGPGDQDAVGVTYKGLAEDLSPGDLMLLDDGLITMRVKDIKGKKIRCVVEAGGVLGNRKGINVQGGGLSLPGIAEHDIADIPRAAAMGVDYLAVSFPRNAEDMHEARRRLQAAGSEAKLV